MLPRDLRAASFRGVRFYVPEDDTEAGRQAIDHSFPDSSIRYMEDNGRILPRFVVTALVAEPGLPGKLRALINALDRPGPGTLKHPWYGSKTVQVDGAYTVRRTDRDSGIVEIDITFAVTGGAIFPGLITGIAAIVSGLAASVAASVWGALSSSYTAPRSPKSRSIVAQRLSDYGTLMDQTFGTSSEAGYRIAVEAESLVTNPARLAELAIDAMRGPFEDENYSANQIVTGFEKVLQYGLDIRAEQAGIDANTLDLVERQENLLLIARAISASAWASMADGMAIKDYVNADLVSRDESKLISYYNDICGCRFLSLGYDDETADNLDRVRTEVSEVLRSVEVRLPRTVGFDPGGNFPASVLSYSLYDSDSRISQLVELNLDENPILFARPVTILEDPT